jgi:Mn-dependent DtxR family transcriptional regulator
MHRFRKELVDSTFLWHTAIVMPSLLTAAAQDYLEQIHHLVDRKGIARVVDIAAAIGVSQASVTSMAQKLDAEGLVFYEKYRGVTLTEQGRSSARAIIQRHQILARLLHFLGLDPTTIHRDVEGMEHHVSRSTFQALKILVEELEDATDLQARVRSRLKLLNKKLAQEDAVG